MSPFEKLLEEVQEKYSEVEADRDEAVETVDYLRRELDQAQDEIHNMQNTIDRLNDELEKNSGFDGFDTSGSDEMGR